MVDGLGNPVDFILTGGEVHDSVCAQDLLANKNADFVLADKAYDSEEILETIDRMQAIAVIPPRINRKEQRYYDKFVSIQHCCSLKESISYYHL